MAKQNLRERLANELFINQPSRTSHNVVVHMFIERAAKKQKKSH